jgi:hypothetical protein
MMASFRARDPMANRFLLSFHPTTFTSFHLDVLALKAPQGASNYFVS